MRLLGGTCLIRPLAFLVKAPAGISCRLRVIRNPTREKYKRAVQLFLDWLHASGESPETLSELDEVLSEYFHDVYYVNGGRGRSHANCVLHGIQMLCPTMKGHFHTSALALKGWERLVPLFPTLRLPMTWQW